MLNFKNYILQEDDELIDVCVQLVQEIIEENYEFTSEEIELSANAEIVLDNIIEYFLENYDYTLTESEQTNSNDELIAEIYGVLLDESIGSMVANIVHGAGGERRAYAKAKLKPDLLKIKAETNPKLFSKNSIPTYVEKQNQHAAKVKSGAYGTGIKGIINKKLGERDVRKSQKKYEKMESDIRIAKSKADVASMRLRQKERKQGNLAYKIDRAIRPTNVARAAIKGTLKGVAWATRKILGKPTRRHYYHYQQRRRYH
jgi:hypothetical protein